MHKFIFLLFLLLGYSITGMSQNKLFTKTGTITFSSKTSIEKIEAINRKALAVLDFTNNKIEFSVLIKGFEFEKALMQEHFNENYLESDRFPKAVFKGQFDEKKIPISFADNTSQNLQVSGNLTMHGITRPITVAAVISVKKQVISATTNFKILLSDYNIKVPSVVANNISKEIQVNINIASLQEIK
jgi:hypothetical protein